MPANLPPDYYAAEKRYREASDIHEKIALLREMLSIMPKHKGTDHLQGDLKRKIAKLNTESQKKKSKGRSSGLDYIPREGAGQAVLVGLPNSGKSSILTCFTNAYADVAAFPFSTFKPVPGMMPFEDIQVQLVDLPPISKEYTESWVYNIVRLADLIILTVDLAQRAPELQMDTLMQIFSDHKIMLQRIGENHPTTAVAYKSTLIVATKLDSDNGFERFEQLKQIYQNQFPVVGLSTLCSMNLDIFRKCVYIGLHVIRVYTKIPGKKSDKEKPYVLPIGTTVYEASVAIHKKLADQMKFARIWGSEKYDGQRVEKNHILEDRDIIEIHTK